ARADRCGLGGAIPAGDAVIDVLVGIGPEAVVDVGPVHVIEEIVIRVGPEYRPDPTDHDAAAPPWPRRAREPAEKDRRVLERGLERRVGDEAIAERGVDPREAGRAREAGRPGPRARSGEGWRAGPRGRD